MKLTSSFAALSSVVVIALCLGKAQADTVTTPLGLTQVDDKGVPITPLTYLNLAPASKELSDAAKKVTTPPPMIKEKRLVPSEALQPVVEQFTSQGISIRAELGHSLIPSLPILGNLDNEGTYTNANPPAAVPQKRLLDALKELQPGEGTQFLPENQQQLGEVTPHPLNRRADNPLNVDLFGNALPEVIPDALKMAKLPGSKRGKSTGLNILGEAIPLDALSLPTNGKRDTPPVDLGLKSGDAENLAAVEKILSSVLANKRDSSPLNIGVGSGEGGPVEALKKLLSGSALAKRGDSPLDLSVGSEKGDPLETIKSLLGGAAPLKRDDSPVDLGLTTGNQQDLEKAQSLLASLLHTKRDAPTEPYDFGLKMGNEQDLERAKSFLGGLLGGKRDTITPDNIDLGSLQAVGAGAEKGVIPLALMPVKQTASPAVQGIKTVNGLCTAFNCHAAVQGAVNGVMKDLPNPLPAARGFEDKNPFENGLLDNHGFVAGVPVKRDQNPAVDAVLDTSDSARDAILDLKTQADDAAGAFVKNMYTKHGEIQTKRSINLPSYSLLPGSGPIAKEQAQKLEAGAKELVDFVGVPIPGVPMKRMEKVAKRQE